MESSSCYIIVQFIRFDPWNFADLRSQVCGILIPDGCLHVEHSQLSQTDSRLIFS